MPFLYHAPTRPDRPAGTAAVVCTTPMRQTGRAAWRSAASAILAAGVTLALTACALPRMIDSDVNSFVGSSPAMAGASYRFERLPSQQNAQPRQDQIERMAEAALAHAGLVRNDAQARYSVQVEVQIAQIPSPHAPRLARRSPILAADGQAYFAPPVLVMEPAWFRHTVHFLLRETASALPAYETTALFDGPWGDSGNLLPAIMDAALSGYPNPPSGPRKVVIELPAAVPAAR